MKEGFSYDGDPSVDNTQAVRFELGDVIEGKSLVKDKEIAYALSKEGDNVLKAAARLAQHLASRFARESVIRTGPISVAKSDVAAHFRQLAKDLRIRSIKANQFITLSLSKAEQDSRRTDTDLPQPSFFKGMHDNKT